MFDESDIAIEDARASFVIATANPFDIIVIFRLHDFIARAEDLPVIAFDFGLIICGGIEGGLEHTIQIIDANNAFTHRSEHLAISLFQAAVNQIDNRIGDILAGITSHDEEIAVFIVGLGGFPFIDAMGVGDDIAILRLAEDIGEFHDGDFFGVDNITQDIACTDGGELVDIANENQASFGLDGREEGGGELYIQHGGFIDDETIAFEGVVFIAGEVLGIFVFDAFDFEEAVDGFGFDARELGHAFGGSASGSGEESGFIERLHYLDDGIYNGSFTCAGAACDNEHAMGLCHLDCLDLEGGEGDIASGGGDI